jgi:hypothetical protein
MVLDDGSSTHFWEDRWLDRKAMLEIASNLFTLIPRQPIKSRTIGLETVMACTVSGDIDGESGSRKRWLH